MRNLLLLTCLLCVIVALGRENFIVITAVVLFTRNLNCIVFVELVLRLRETERRINILMLKNRDQN